MKFGPAVSEKKIFEYCGNIQNSILAQAGADQPLGSECFQSHKS